MSGLTDSQMDDLLDHWHDSIEIKESFCTFIGMTWGEYRNRWDYTQSRGETEVADNE